MNVLRHQNISSNHEAVPHTQGLKLTLEDGVRRLRAQQRLTTITTERDKVKTAALLVTDELRHNWRILYPPMSELHASPPFARKKRRMGHPHRWQVKGAPPGAWPPMGGQAQNNLNPTTFLNKTKDRKCEKLWTLPLSAGAGCQKNLLPRRFRESVFS